jgi:hypothetical protein
VSSLQAKGEVKEALIEAVVIRADGTREDLGVVSYWHRNPLKRLIWRLGWQRS